MKKMYTFDRFGKVYPIDHPENENELSQLDEKWKNWFEIMKDRRGFYDTEEEAKIAYEETRPQFVAIGVDMRTGEQIGYWE